MSYLVFGLRAIRACAVTVALRQRFSQETLPDAFVIMMPLAASMIVHPSSVTDRSKETSHRKVIPQGNPRVKWNI
ncbi:unnamed protein product [Boreogadus saida]